MTECRYEQTGYCPRLCEFVEDSFRMNIEELSSLCQQYLDGKLLQRHFLEKMEACEEKSKLVSDKVIRKLLKEYWRQNQ